MPQLGICPDIEYGFFISTRPEGSAASLGS